MSLPDGIRRGEAQLEGSRVGRDESSDLSASEQPSQSQSQDTDHPSNSTGAPVLAKQAMLLLIDPEKAFHYLPPSHDSAAWTGEIGTFHSGLPNPAEPSQPAHSTLMASPVAPITQASAALQDLTASMMEETAGSKASSNQTLPKVLGTFPILDHHSLIFQHVAPICQPDAASYPSNPPSTSGSATEASAKARNDLYNLGCDILHIEFESKLVSDLGLELRKRLVDPLIDETFASAFGIAALEHSRATGHVYAEYEATSAGVATTHLLTLANHYTRIQSFFTPDAWKRMTTPDRSSPPYFVQPEQSGRTIPDMILRNGGAVGDYKREVVGGEFVQTNLANATTGRGAEFHQDKSKANTPDKFTGNVREIACTAYTQMNAEKKTWAFIHTPLSFQLFKLVGANYMKVSPALHFDAGAKGEPDTALSTLIALITEESIPWESVKEKVYTRKNGKLALREEPGHDEPRTKRSRRDTGSAGGAFQHGDNTGGPGGAEGSGSSAARSVGKRVAQDTGGEGRAEILMRNDENEMLKSVGHDHPEADGLSMPPGHKVYIGDKRPEGSRKATGRAGELGLKIDVTTRPEGVRARSSYQSTHVKVGGRTIELSSISLHSCENEQDTITKTRPLKIVSEGDIESVRFAEHHNTPLLALGEAIGQGRLWTVYSGTLYLPRRTSATYSHDAQEWGSDCSDSDASNHSQVDDLFDTRTTLYLLPKQAQYTPDTSPLVGTHSPKGYPVAIKICLLSNLPDEVDSYSGEYDRNTASTAIDNEAAVYREHLRELRGIAIPEYYGLFDGTVAGSASQNLRVMVLERVGPAVTSSENINDAGTSATKELKTLYQMIHAKGVCHGDVQSRHVRRLYPWSEASASYSMMEAKDLKEGRWLRLIDFDGAVVGDQETLSRERTLVGRIV